jgi:rhodanese-related sulfurtransferase
MKPEPIAITLLRSFAPKKAVHAAVLHAVEDGKFDFVLLDTRGRESFASGHIPGALCAPIDELDQLAASLPKDKEIVTYCWGHD